MALTDGQLACWDLDEASGDRTDHVGGVVLQTHGSVPAVPGQVGNALSFDGNSENYLTGGDFLSNLTAADFTIAFYIWIPHPAQLDSPSMVVMGNGNTSTYDSTDFEWIVEVDTGGGIAIHLGGGAEFSVGPSTTLRYREWQLITICGETIEGPPSRRVLTMYQDNGDAGSINMPDVIYPHANFVIGRVGTFIPIDDTIFSPYPRPYPLEGMVDTLMVWQRALTLQERQDLWNDGAARACAPPPPGSPGCEPLPDWIAYGATGGPEWGTALFAAPGGWEARTQMWAQVRGRWDVSFVNVSKAQAQVLVDFFRAVAHGRAGSFCFMDWRDHSFANVIGTGDGTTSSFQLVKVYTSGTLSYARPLTRPIVSSLVVTVNGVETSAYTVDPTSGRLLFPAPPANGAVMHAAGDFEVLVRFETDQLMVTCVTPEVFSCTGLGLVELIGE